MVPTRGQRWVEARSGRIVIVLDPDYEDGAVQWHFADESPSKWHYSDVHDFVVCGTFSPENLEKA